MEGAGYAETTHVVIKKPNDQQIFEVLSSVITSKEPVPWASLDGQRVSIVGTINALMVIKNWMKVRNVLQYMISKGLAKRTDSIKTEEYFKP